MKLNELVTEIKKDNKIPVDELLDILSESVSEGVDSVDTYKMLYKKAYGNHLSKETCEHWVKGLEITDGSDRTSGEKWNVDKAMELGQRMGVDWQKMTKYEWYAVMNAWYSDFYRTAKKYELETVPEFYADLVMDYFCNDTDSHDKSVFCYYFNHVV